MKIQSISKKTWLYIICGVLGSILLILILYTSIENGTGFWDYVDTNGEKHSGKVLWDWFELLIVPLFLAFAVSLYTSQATEREKNLELYRQRERALQEYYDYIENKKVTSSLKIIDEEITLMLQARTHSAFRMLDGFRKGSLFMFLYNMGYIRKPNGPSKQLINLDNADLSGIQTTQLHQKGNYDSFLHLSGVDLEGADLRNANLPNVRFSEMNFSKANLAGANLQNCVINNCDFREAILENCNLKCARIYGSHFQKANLKNTNLTSVSFDDKCRLYELDFADPNDVIVDPIDFSGADLSKATFFCDVLPNQIEKARKYTKVCLPGGLVENGRYSLFEIVYEADPSFDITKTAHPGMGFRKIIMGRCRCGEIFKPLYPIGGDFVGLWYGYIAHRINVHGHALVEHKEYGGRDFKPIIKKIIDDEKSKQVK